METPIRSHSTLIRRLALAKLRELRRQGMSYREIGRRFGGPEPRPAAPGGFRHRVSAERLLVSRNEDSLLFFRALDALEQGLAFFDPAGCMLSANRPLTRLLDDREQGGRLRAELDNFAETLWRLTRLRGLSTEPVVEELAVQEVPLEPSAIVLKGSYIGLDLFGGGASVLVVVESPPDDPLSPASLRLRFGLTRQECRIARHLADGSSNAEIADRAVLSPHTVRRHTEAILRKLEARSRAEAVARMLRHDRTSGMN